MTTRIAAFDLGLAPYAPVQDLQARLREAVADGRLSGALLLLEHPPVITLGSRGGPDDLTTDAGGPLIPVQSSERGGAATLHAPGQLVSYPVVRLPRRDLRAYVASLEEVLIRLLGDVGLAAERSPGRPGLYVEERKIASIGLRCQRWVSSHGTSLNVDVDLDLFDRIVSCGEAGLQQTSILAELGTAPTMSQVKAAYVERFAEVFGWEVEQPLQRSWDLLGGNWASEPDADRSAAAGVVRPDGRAAGGPASRCSRTGTGCRRRQRDDRWDRCLPPPSESRATAAGSNTNHSFSSGLPPSLPPIVLLA